MRVPLPALWKESLRRRFANWSVIAMLHRVNQRDPRRLADNESLKIRPELLEAFITTARTSRWAFVSMDELTENLSRGRVPKKTIAMTLDDGYVDNLTVAAPVFRGFSVPYCMYLTTGLVMGSVSMWWYELEAVVLSNSELRTPDDELLSCSDARSKQQAFARIKKAIMSPDPYVRDETQSWLRQQSRKMDESLQELDRIMTWPEVVQFSRDPLATVGAHTVTHPVLLSLDEMSVAAELADSKREIESRIGMEVRHFAYPFGGTTAAGTREFRMARECGYRSAVTTRSGRLDAESLDLHALPRLNFTEEFGEGLVSAFGTKSIANACKRALAIH